MRPRILSHILIFVFLIIAACSGKSQLVRNTHAETHASSEAVANPKEASTPSIADEAEPTVSLSKEETAPPMGPPKKNRKASVKKRSPEKPTPSLRKPKTLSGSTQTPSLPALSSTATVSTNVPVAENPSPAPSDKKALKEKRSTQPSLPQEVPAQKKPAPAVPDEENIEFNFDNADIHEVVGIISDILGFNYIVDPRLSGVVNIQTKGTISKKDLFPILETLLKINNFTIIKKGEFYHIVAFQAVSKEPLLPKITLDRDALPYTDKLVFQIVPLKFVSAQEMAKTIQPLMTQGSYMLGLAETNLLIMIEFSANLKKLLAIIDLFDIDVFEKLHMQLYEAVSADVEELATDIETVFQAFELPDASAKAGGINILPLTRINMLLAVSSNEGLVEKAIQWAHQLDTDVSETAIKVFVYYVQNGKAADIADVLTQVFKGGEQKKKQTKFKSKLRTTTPAQKQKEKPAPKAPVRTARQAAASAGVEEVEVDVVVDEVNNALIIRATERDYRIVERTIKKLDIYPKQVLIEVLIAEIRLDDEFKMGVEWEYMNEMDGAQYDVDVTGVASLASEFTSGLKYVVDKTDRFKATLQAFASDDKVNILSSPHIIASDNMEAKINVAEEIPIVSGKVTTTSAEPVVTETVEYRDTGIILTVTPHINDRGLVTLDVSQEVSEVSVAGDRPTFLNRSAQTSMVVQSGQSVIIGGLIRETWSYGKQGVPILSRIPVMGSLFGIHKKIANRSELMLLLTPHVITSIEEADLITREFQDKLSIIEEQQEQ